MIAFHNNSTAMSSDTIIMPPDFDGFDQPFFKCTEKFDKNFDVNSHLRNSPVCVGGRILDSIYWKANPNEPDEYPTRRLPKILGWNFIDDTSSANFDHPNPDTVFYPAHNAWSPGDPLCWGTNQHIMGLGTGRPYKSDCSHIKLSYSDAIIDLTKPGCNSDLSSCFNVLRTWIIFDSCIQSVDIRTQLIKITDTEGPTILYPDTLVVNTESHLCLGRWEVSPAWLIDNCSNELHYSVKVEHGLILGNETSGYVIVNMPIGMQVAKIIAEDCCGNITEKKVILLVEDNTPPNAVCDSKVVVSITGNQSPGKNYAKIFTHDLGIVSTDNCDTIVAKIIRLDKLKGTNNGSHDDQQDNELNCNGINGDDNKTIDGNQIYFDDEAIFCCSDVGKTISLVIRVFDRNPGVGPVNPSAMSKGGILYNRFFDCLTQVEVQDKTVPTLVAPPNIVVSCAFAFDIDKLNDPNDSTFGSVVTDLSLRKKVSTLDKVCYNYCVKNPKTGYPGYEIGSPPSNPPASNRACDYYRSLFDTTQADRIYELVWGFDGYSLSSCENSPTISITDSRICGQGKITRKITTNGQNGVMVTATQTIWIVECDPFYINRNDACDQNDDIIWPGNCNGQATTISQCGFNVDPEDPLVGKPLIDKKADDHCSSIDISYSDKLFPIEPDACLKVNRQWVVIDRCQYNPLVDSINGKWEYLQIIKIHDNEKPTSKINISNQSILDSNEMADINLTVDISDNCDQSNDLLVSYKIDEFNDGIGPYGGYDYRVGPLSINAYNLGETPLINDNPHAFYPRNTVDASGKYIIGIHKIAWEVEDSCANTGFQSKLFEIKKIVSTLNTNLTEQLIIMPNPTRGNTLIRSERKMDMIQLISSTGQKIQRFIVQDKKSFELNNLASGVYFVQAYFKGNHVASVKLVIME